MSTLVKVQGRDLAPSLLSCPFSRDLERLPWNPAIVGVWSQKRLPWNDCIGCEDLLKSESKSDNFLPVWCTSYLLCAQMAFFHLVCISFPLKFYFHLNCIVCIALGLHCAAASVTLHCIGLCGLNCVDCTKHTVHCTSAIWIAVPSGLHWIVWIAQVGCIVIHCVDCILWIAQCTGGELHCAPLGAGKPSGCSTGPTLAAPQ